MRRKVDLNGAPDEAVISFTVWREELEDISYPTAVKRLKSGDAPPFFPIGRRGENIELGTTLGAARKHIKERLTKAPKLTEEAREKLAREKAAKEAREKAATTGGPGE
jgi:hypothetical protein